MKNIYVNCRVKNYMNQDHPSWLVNLTGRALHRYHRGQGFESRTSLNILFRLSFRNCKSCVYNCDDLHSCNSSLRHSHICFSYFQNFIIIVSRVYNELIQRPAPSWFVRLSFRNCKSCVYNAAMIFRHIKKLSEVQTFWRKLKEVQSLPTYNLATPTGSYRNIHHRNNQYA